MRGQILDKKSQVLADSVERYTIAANPKAVPTYKVRVFFFSSRSRHTRSLCDWSSDVCSSDLWAFPGRTCRISSRGWRIPSIKIGVKPAELSIAHFGRRDVTSSRSMLYATVDARIRPSLSKSGHGQDEGGPCADARAHRRRGLALPAAGHPDE